MSIESILELTYLQDNAPDKLDALRLTLEPHIYNYLIEKYSTYLSEHWKTYEPPKKARRSYVIVERRAHPNFWFILRNIAWACPTMSVYIFCSDENSSYIRSLLKDKIQFFTIIVWFKGPASREEGKIQYNNIYTDYRMYEAIDSEYILTVQMDTIFRRKIPESLFCGDYWGSPWGWNPTMPGGGGATIRHVKKMIELCKQYRPDIHVNMKDPEDGWISNMIVKSNGTFPSFEFRRDHCMENVPANNPIVLHQFWTFSDTYRNWNTNERIMYWTHLLTFEL